MTKITPKNFRTFGWVIGPGDRAARSKSVFRVVLKEKNSRGWRIGFLLLRKEPLDTFEKHPDSFESFEPVSGKTLIFVSRGKRLSNVRCFELDKPVILDKGVWHAVFTLTPESGIKITENAEVQTRYWKLPGPLNPPR